MLFQSLNNIVLFSPLEGFKSYTYTFVLDSLVDNSWSTESLFTDFLVPEVYLNGTIGLFLGIIFFVTFIILAKFYLDSSEDDVEDENLRLSLFSSKEFLVVIIAIPFIFLYSSWNSVNHFYQLLYDSASNSVKSLYFEEHTIFFSFLKDIWAFIVIFLAVSLFSSKSFSNLRLFSMRPLDSLSEFIYNLSLGLFSSSLDIKHHHEVRYFQEFFIKMHAFLLFILGSNLVGMIPYGVTITSSLMNTLFLSLVLFFNIIYTMINEKGINAFFDSFLPAGCPLALAPLLIPIEVISYSFRLISLSVRLFANMMAGHTLLKVIGGFSWSLMGTGDSTFLLHYAPFFILFLLTFLELGVAFIQAYIFVLLGYLYLREIFAGH